MLKHQYRFSCIFDFMVESNRQKKIARLIQKDLSTHLKRKLKINYTYNPDLIGGFKIKIGSIMIDTSIKNKLKRLEKMMIES